MTDCHCAGRRKAPKPFENPNSDVADEMGKAAGLPLESSWVEARSGRSEVLEVFAGTYN